MIADFLELSSELIVLSLDYQVLIFYEFLREAKQSAIFHARAIARRSKAWFVYA